MEYYINDISQKMKLCYTFYTNIELDEIELFIDNSKIPLTKNNSDFYKPIYFQYTKTGLFKLKLNIKKTLTTMSWLFTNSGNIKSFKFLPGFDSSKVIDMELLFASNYMESIDIKYLYTSSVINFDSFIASSHKLKSIDFSNFNTAKAKIMRSMFDFVNVRDSPLKELDISSFDTSQVDNCLVMF